MFLEDIKIVLNKVSEPGNAGAVCRAMKNMGLLELRLAAPQPMDPEKILVRAVHAFDLWESAKVYDTFADSVKDCSIVVGTTRRRGQNRKNVSMTPRNLAAWLADRPGPAAIVFGNERTGLEDADLKLCNIASHIPVSYIHPSLNLSHAVQIYAYELFLALETQCPQSKRKNVKGEWQAMNQQEISAIADSITGTLADLGFYKQYGKDVQKRFLHDFISRAGLTEREGRYFKDIFDKAARLGSRKNDEPRPRGAGY